MEETFIGLEFGDKRIFQYLYESRNYNIEKIYSSLLNTLLNSDFWSETRSNAPRVLCKDGKLCRELKRQVFSQVGLYLWGAGSTPLYIGKTEDCFKNRFNRYIWDKKSQYNLAIKLEYLIKKNNIQNIPEEYLIKIRKILKVSNVRLQGAAVFAKHGINNVWFALFPTDNINEIDELEKILIPIVNNWNIKNNLNTILNIKDK